MTEPSRVVPTPHGDGRLVHRPARRQPDRRRCCSATAPAAASTPATSVALADAPARATGSPWCCFEQPWRVAGRKVATAARRRSTRADRGRAAAPAAHGAARASAAARPGPGRPRRCARELGRRRAAWRWRSRCTRPAGRRRPGSHELQRCPACRRWWSRASGTRMGRPEEFPADLDTGRRTRRRPRLQGAEGGAGHARPRRCEIIVEATLEWIVREVAGESASRR